MAAAGFHMRTGCTCNPGACYGGRGRAGGEGGALWLQLPGGHPENRTGAEHAAALPSNMPSRRCHPNLAAADFLGVREEEVQEAAQLAQGNFS